MARLAPASLGPIAGAAALGRLYAAQAMMMPINFVLMAVFTFSVPEAARKLRNGPGHLNRYLISLSGGLAGVVMVFAMVVRFLPARIGELYVGDNWAHGRDILLPLVLTVLGVALATGGWVGLLTHSRPTTVLWGSSVAGTLQVVGSAVGAALAGLTGAAWGMALASVCSAVIWWVLLARTAPTPFPQLPRQSGAGAGVVSRDRGADGQLALHG
jgi:O-antigen/teichoic acid export membrane protein